MSLLLGILMILSIGLIFLPFKISSIWGSIYRTIKERCCMCMIIKHVCVYLSLRGFKRRLERVQVNSMIYSSTEKSWSKGASRRTPRPSRASCRNSCSTVLVSFRAWAACTHACSAWDWYISMLHVHKWDSTFKSESLLTVSFELVIQLLHFWSEIKVRIIISIHLPPRMLANQAADWSALAW